MALSRVRFGDLIQISDEKNINGEPYPFYGININKEFMPSVANTTNVDAKKYKVIRKNRFVFSGMQTGRDNCIRIGMYEKEEPVLVSPAYTTFEVTNSLILPTYFFMIFKSKEMDRYGAFLSDSSVRSNLDWDRFCDIELEVPPIEIQKKYVAIYEGLLANLRSYEKGLDDLKLVCDGYIEELRKKYKPEKLHKYIEQYKIINKDLKVKKLAGLIGGKIKEARKSSGQDDLSKFQVVYPNTIVYPPPHFGEVGTIGIVNDEPILLSPMYISFKAKDERLVNMHYILLWCYRNEFKRYAFFAACDSVRDTFDFDKLCEYAIPIPPVEIQNNIVRIYTEMEKRKEYLATLKHQISSICPILIRGAILDAQGGN